MTEPATPWLSTQGLMEQAGITLREAEHWAARGKIPFWWAAATDPNATAINNGGTGHARRFSPDVVPLVRRVKALRRIGIGLDKAFEYAGALEQSKVVGLGEGLYLSRGGQIVTDPPRGAQLGWGGPIRHGTVA